MPLRKCDFMTGMARKFPVRSMSNGALYVCVLWGSGNWSCDCPNWCNVRSKAEDHTEKAPPENHCKHIRDDAMPASRLDPAALRRYVARVAPEMVAAVLVGGTQEHRGRARAVFEGDV